MTTRMSDLLWGALDELRYEPIEKRIRAMLGATTVVDTTRAMLVWEPKRVVPYFAVPVEEVNGEFIAAEAPPDTPDAGTLDFLYPGIPFAVHSTEGAVVAIRVPGEQSEPAAFRIADPALDGYVVLDFKSFDAWYEEEERLDSHARDPYHRVDILESSRSVRIEAGGQVLAETSRPRLVFETNLPVRFYIPRADVVADLRPSDRRTRCAYKGEASYWSPEVEGEALGDIAWSYEEPRRDAAPLAGMVAFFDEKVDTVVDGEPRPRPATKVSESIVAEVGI